MACFCSFSICGWELVAGCTVHAFVVHFKCYFAFDVSSFYTFFSLLFSIALTISILLISFGGTIKGCCWLMLYWGIKYLRRLQLVGKGWLQASFSWEVMSQIMYYLFCCCFKYLVIIFLLPLSLVHTGLKLMILFSILCVVYYR